MTFKIIVEKNILFSLSFLPIIKLLCRAFDHFPEFSNLLRNYSNFFLVNRFPCFLHLKYLQIVYAELFYCVFSSLTYFTFQILFQRTDDYFSEVPNSSFLFTKSVIQNWLQNSNSSFFQDGNLTLTFRAHTFAFLLLLWVTY